MSEMMFRPSDAPTPTWLPEAPLVVAGTAVAVSAALFTEVNETSPPPAVTEAPVSIRA